MYPVTRKRTRPIDAIRQAVRPTTRAALKKGSFCSTAVLPTRLCLSERQRDARGGHGKTNSDAAARCTNSYADSGDAHKKRRLPSRRDVGSAHSLQESRLWPPRRYGLLE